MVPEFPMIYIIYKQLLKVLRMNTKKHFKQKTLACCLLKKHQTSRDQQLLIIATC